MMKVLTLLCSFAAFGSATPAPAQWQEKRAAAAAPAYAAHTINQPVCIIVFLYILSLLIKRRLTISLTPTVMNRTRKIPLSSGTFSTRLTTSLADQYSSILVERLAEKVDSPTYRLEVSAQYPLKLHSRLICVVIQILMQKFNGLGVILENRYYGQSYPYNTSSTDELRFLTTEQSKNCVYRGSLPKLM
jgi:hypothetical protein